MIPRQSSLSAARNLTHHKSDLSKASLTEVFTAARPDLVISTVSGGSYDTQRQIIDCALEARIAHFIPAEFGHDSLNEGIQDRLPPAREKARVIAYLNSLAADGRMSWVAIATGFPVDHGLMSGNLGFDLQWQSATLHGSGEERFAASSTAWLGRTVLSVIQQWDDVQNQYLYISSMITSANELLQCARHVSGKQWEAGRADVEECVREAERRIARGFPDAGMFLMERSVLYDESLAAVQPFLQRDAKGRLGLQGESVEEVVHEALHQHDHHGKGGCGCD